MEPEKDRLSRIARVLEFKKSMPEPTLDRLDQKIEDLRTTLREHVMRFEKHDTLERDFQNDLYEHLLRLDRLEQVEAARKWHIRTMWGAWLAAFVGWLFSLLHHWGSP